MLDYYDVLIFKIENVMADSNIESFELISNVLFSHQEYESSVNVRIENYISNNPSESDFITSNKVLKSSSDSIGIKNSLVEVHLFAKIIEKSFKDINLDVILSCFQFFKSFCFFPVERSNKYASFQYFEF